MVALAFAAGSSVSGSHNALPEAVVPYSHSFANCYNQCGGHFIRQLPVRAPLSSPPNRS